METFEIVIKTLFGLENVLAEEVKKLGAKDIKILNRAVSCRVNKKLLYKSNLYLRTAVKILKPVASFYVQDDKDLYIKVKKINWEEYISYKKTFVIDATISGKIFTHSKYIALKSKDAIVDIFRDKYGIRPSVDTINPDIRINVHIAGNICNISLDSSGVSLGKRGYKMLQTAAPLNEILAAGMIYLSGWDKTTEFLDPMCGSGTIPIEATMMACNVPPGQLREFAFEKWYDFDAVLWEKIKKESTEDIKPVKTKITANDIDINAVEITRKNAKIIGVDKYMEIEKSDFFSSTPKINNGLIMMNPPYGERLPQKEIIDFYGNIGSKLKHSYSGSAAWILSGNTTALKHIGLKPAAKIKLFNGKIECKFHKLDLYRGSKKKSNILVEK